MLGTCKYCGQICDAKAETQAEANAIASADCDCLQARQERELKRRIESAEEKLDELCGENCEKYGFEPIDDEHTIDFIKKIINHVARSDINSAAVSILGGIRIAVKKGSKGTLKVSRSESRSYELEE